MEGGGGGQRGRDDMAKDQLSCFVIKLEVHTFKCPDAQFGVFLSRLHSPALKRDPSL